MSLTDLDLKSVYNHSNCPDMIAGLYEPLLQEAIRCDRTTYTFTAKGLLAAAGTAGLIWISIPSQVALVTCLLADR